MEHIQKSFFGVKVLKDVSFGVDTGEVHALLGENGAGKSTLMNILAGVYTRDEGSVVFDGKELTNGSIADSEQAGIAFVHQELNIFNDLKVYQGIIWGKITIDSVKEKVIFTNIEKKALAEIETAISSAMMEEKKKYGTLNKH